MKNFIIIAIFLLGILIIGIPNIILIQIAIADNNSYKERTHINSSDVDQKKKSIYYRYSPQSQIQDKKVIGKENTLEEFLVTDQNNRAPSLPLVENMQSQISSDNLYIIEGNINITGSDPLSESISIANCNIGDIVLNGGYLGTEAPISISRPLDDFSGWTTITIGNNLAFRSFAVCFDNP